MRRASALHVRHKKLTDSKYSRTPVFTSNCSGNIVEKKHHRQIVLRYLVRHPGHRAPEGRVVVIGREDAAHGVGENVRIDQDRTGDRPSESSANG